MKFTDIRQDFYHLTPCGPMEKRAGRLEFSDISSHLPVLEYFSSLCEHVTEFGVREGQSTVALLSGQRYTGEVHSWDIEETSAVKLLRGMNLPCPWYFHQGDTGIKQDVSETDFLFFDTLHTYEHLSKELELFGHLARRFIGFHDTFTCGERDVSGEDSSAKGILPAILNFISGKPYVTRYKTDHCNGLWILEKISR